MTSTNSDDSSQSILVCKWTSLYLYLADYFSGSAKCSCEERRFCSDNMYILFSGTTKAPIVSFVKVVFFRFYMNRKSFTVTIISRFPCTAQVLFSLRFQTFENIIVDLA